MGDLHGDLMTVQGGGGGDLLQLLRKEDGEANVCVHHLMQCRWFFVGVWKWRIKESDSRNWIVIKLIIHATEGSPGKENYYLTIISN